PSSHPLRRSLVLITRRPPGSTLFPYTTLFRSTHRRRMESQLGRPGTPRPRPASRRNRRPDRRPGGRRRETQPDPAHTRPRRTTTDRKSTRLNSSHVKTSYAVFCLKKKTRRPER